jgi:hypothetical protein
MKTIAKFSALTSLLLAASVSVCHASPVKTGAAATQTATVKKEVCRNVSTTVPVSDGADKYGFPKNLRMETRTIRVCRME